MNHNTCQGNQDCHVILRGGKSGPNYSSDYIQSCKKQLLEANLQPSIMVDCSHGNSQKKHKNQIVALEDICKQLEQGEEALVGVMIESNLVEGSQKIPEDLKSLVYGQSVTDACVGWADTETMLLRLQAAVKQRRACRQQKA